VGRLFNEAVSTTEAATHTGLHTFSVNQFVDRLFNEAVSTAEAAAHTVLHNLLVDQFVSYLTRLYQLQRLHFTHVCTSFGSLLQW
jgi:hypothetical protein